MLMIQASSEQACTFIACLGSHLTCRACHTCTVVSSKLTKSVGPDVT